MGLHWAFPHAEIFGVDINPQPRYPFNFIQKDVFSITCLDNFDFIWASPPCQRYSSGAKKWGTSNKHPDLISPTRFLLQVKGKGKSYVIENIMAAKKHLANPIMLCGQYFNLGVFRHRLFETNFKVIEPEHVIHNGRIGDGKYFTVTGHAGGSSKRDGWIGGSTEDWKRAMNIDWMIGKELSEAIPPNYSEYIGNQYKESL